MSIEKKINSIKSEIERLENELQELEKENVHFYALVMYPHDDMLGNYFQISDEAISEAETKRIIQDEYWHYADIYPNKTIWMYTGYLYDEVKDLEILKYVDVLVDGPFKKDLADVNYHWAGSTNQKVINLHHAAIQNV